jgi:hypothetical protein
VRKALTRLARQLTPTPFRKLRLDELVAALPPDQRDEARSGAEASPTPLIPSLPYTEARLEWMALYRHCQRGQIDPSILRRMKDIDLEYLAGSPPLAELSRLKATGASQEQQQSIHLKAAKLHANITRATRELQRRYAIRIGATIAVLSLLLTVITSRVL